MKPVVAIVSRKTEQDGQSRYVTPEAYVAAVMAAGGCPMLIPTVTEADSLLALLDLADALLVTGGGDVDPRHYGQQPFRELGQINPSSDEADRVLIEAALNRPQLPLLGICRGIQAINVFAGGSLVQDIGREVKSALKHQQQAPVWYGTHEISIEANSKLRSLVGRERHRVNSFHHQAVREVAEGWRVTARTADGVVEAIECEEGLFRLGVQYHPEHMVARDPRMKAIFEGFVAAARHAAGKT